MHFICQKFLGEQAILEIWNLDVCAILQQVYFV